MRKGQKVRVSINGETRYAIYDEAIPSFWDGECLHAVQIMENGKKVFVAVGEDSSPLKKDMKNQRARKSIAE